MDKRKNWNLLTIGLFAVLWLANCDMPAETLQAMAGKAGVPFNTVGSISANFSINQHGAATYSIPINAAPGVNGLNPELTLAYSSQNGNGLFGYGWNLSGLSAITRCSITRGDERYPVTYSSEDRFCLEGQYLIPVTGNYGAQGTIYHTERESWVRVQAFYEDGGKKCGSGPCSFTVTLKNGTTLTYGGTEDSRIEAVAGDNVDSIPSGSVRVWTVNRHEDLNQNYLEYRYKEDINSGEYCPDVVLYGGNDVAGQMPQRAVQFDFDDSTQPLVLYQGGARIVHSKVINKITSCIADVPIANCTTDPAPRGFSNVAVYAFDIEYNQVARQNYLQSVQLSGADGSTVPATRFTYNAALTGPIEFEQAVNWTSFFSQNNGWTQPCQSRTVGDINGDGRFDLIGFGSNYTVFALSDGLPISSPEIRCMNGDKVDHDSGCTSESEYFSCKAGFGDDKNNPRMMADVNGDGLYDIVSLGTNNIHVSISQGSNFKQETIWGDFLVSDGGWSTSDLRTVADIDGDGLTDIIGFGESTAQFGLSTGDSFGKGPVLQNFFSKDDGYSIEDGNPPMLGDVNGDGRIDVVGIKTDQGERKAFVGLFKGDSFAPQGVWNDNLSKDGKPLSLEAGKNPIFLLDLNNDRLADLVFFGNDNIYVSFSTGASFNAPEIWNSTNFTYNNGGWDDTGQPGGTLRTFADISGDGKPDVIGFGVNKVQFGINTGSSFVVDDTLFAPITTDFIYQSMGYLQANPRFPADMNGDGVSDLLGLGTNNAIIGVAPKNQNVLTSIVDGLGEITEICYQSASASASDVVGECTDKDKSYNVYTTLEAGEFNPDDMKWCEGRCREYNSPVLVVKSRTNKNGEADTQGYRYEYSYAGALIDREGYGSLGFRRSTETDLQVNQTADKPGAQYVSWFRQMFPFKGELDTMKMVRVSDGRLLGMTDYEYQIADPKQNVHTYLVQTKQQTTDNYGTQGSASYTVQKTLTYDAYGNIHIYGNLGNINDPSDDLYQKIRYNNDTTNWILGYPVDVRLCPTDACTDILNHKQYQYNDQRNVVYSRAHDDTNKVWLGSEFSNYDAFGNVRTINKAWWSANGEKQQSYDQVTITYDSTLHTYPNTKTNALQQVSTTKYDGRFGTILEATDINSNRFVMHYDGFSRIKKIYGPDPQGSKTLLEEHEYGIQNNEMFRKMTRTTEWDGSLAWETDFFDTLGRTYRKETEATSGTIIQLTCYQSETQVKQFSLPYYEVNNSDDCSSNSASYWTQYIYDSLKRPKEITHPDQSITQILYAINSLDNYNRDYVERTDSVGLPEERTIASYLTPNNDVLKRIFPNQEGVTQEQAVVHKYDHLGRKKLTIAPGKVTTHYDYDSLNRITSADNSDSGVTKTSYYRENGLVKQVVDSTGTTHSYDKYDAILRLKKERYLKDNQSRTIEYTFDTKQQGCYNFGRLTSVSDTAGINYNYCYDAYGNNNYGRLELTTEGKNYNIATQFDPLGRVSRFTFPDGMSMQRFFNIEGPLNKVKLCEKGGQNCEQYASWSDFSASGHPATLTYLNGVETNYTYNPATGNVKTLNSKRISGKVLLDKSYRWNTLGLLTRVDDKLNADYSMAFTPDKAGSIKNAVVGEAAGQLSLDYAYNVTGALAQKGATKFTKYIGQKLMSSEIDGVETTYDYYANANLKDKTSKGVSWHYTYNGQNLLSSVTKTTDQQTSEASYLYDYKGSLIKRTDAEGVVSYYINKNYDITIYPNAKEAIYTKTLDSLTGDVATISTSGQFASQIFSVDLSPERTTPDPTTISVSDPQDGGAVVPAPSGLQGDGYPVAGTKLFFHSDQTGGTTLVTDEKATEKTYITYFPFGDIYQQLSYGPNDFRAKFAGRELNEDIGLYFFNARFYDPSIGQFIQADDRIRGGPPISASSYNRFAYAGNNPITYVDPSGHSFGDFIKNMGTSVGISALIFEIVNPEFGAFYAVGAVGAYWGGESVNHDKNPLHWDWKSGKTYLGLAAGFAVTAGGTAIAIVAPEAVPEEAGAFAAFLAGLGTATVVGFSQNATFATLGGANASQVMLAGLEGAAIGDVLYVGASSIGVAFGSNIIDAAADDAVEMASFGSESAAEGADTADVSFSCSFIAGTQIHTVDGLKAIEQIKLSDKVWAYDVKEKRPDVFHVTAEFSGSVTGYIVLRVGNEIIRTTKEHPFYVVGKGWINAENLMVGDLLQTKSGETIGVQQLDYKSEPVKVYNFRVVKANNYYVSDIGLWVHNPGTCGESRVEAGDADPSAPKSESKIIYTTEKQLQRKFKHAQDFGVTGNFNTENAKEFNSAINQHVYASGTKQIFGTFKKARVTHFIDAETGLNVMTDPNGNFISGWRLNEPQLQNVLERGGL